MADRVLSLLLLLLLCPEFVVVSSAVLLTGIFTEHSLLESAIYLETYPLERAYLVGLD